MRPIVEARNLSKLYRLGGTGGGSLKDVLAKWRKRGPAAASAVRSGRSTPGEARDFWALRDVSFDVERGEVVGLVGRNGAGKSTLLKLLSRITEPTSGRAILRGRVASLLEVGTGFHPDLTGRENIFLNGAILGMRRGEIATKFDEIVEFSEVGPFLDTPVKRFSSGMFVRLAFAVAAHLEPEILLIDEVLAVGDAGFQKKCLGKMSEVATRHGRTVFFVSHNMGALRALCDRCILLEGGELQMQGDPAEVIRRYLSLTLPADAAQTGERRWDDPATAPSCAEMRLVAVSLMREGGEIATAFEASEPIQISIEYEVLARLRGARFDLFLLTEEGDIAFTATDHLFQPESQEPGMYRTVCRIPGKLLNRRSYIVKLHSVVPGERALIWEAEYLRFSVSGAGNQASHHPENWPGVVCPSISWEVDRLSDRAHPDPVAV